LPTYPEDLFGIGEWAGWKVRRVGVTVDVSETNQWCDVEQVREASVHMGAVAIAASLKASE
jgi:hypothetical protein